MQADCNYYPHVIAEEWFAQNHIVIVGSWWRLESNKKILVCRLVSYSPILHCLYSVRSHELPLQARGTTAVLLFIAGPRANSWRTHMGNSGLLNLFHLCCIWKVGDGVSLGSIMINSGRDWAGLNARGGKWMLRPLPGFDLATGISLDLNQQKSWCRPRRSNGSQTA